MTTSELGESLWAIRCVWLRYFDVARKSMVYYLVTMFTEPILYLLSFGVGVGALIGEIHTHGMTVKYRTFIFSGILGQTLLFQSFFEAAYGAFIRMYYQRIFQAMATTPITLSEVLWGELLWGASRSTLAAEVVALMGVVIGDFPPWSLLALLPIAFLSALLFSGLGLLVAAKAKTIEEISYPQYLFVFPMFLFCGVFYPLDRLPDALKALAWVFPLTSVLSLARTVTIGFPFEPLAVLMLVAWLALALAVSRRSMIGRLVK